MIISEVLKKSHKITNQDINGVGKMKVALPALINVDFDATYTNLKSLKGGPKRVSGNVFCYSSSLETLIGGPEWVLGTYDVSNTNITSLKGSPEFVGSSFNCEFCNLLKSLSGGPMHVGGISLSGSNVTSFEGIGVKYLKECKTIDVRHCAIESHVLGLLLVKELKDILTSTKYPAITIINRHLTGNRDILECQEELIQAGLKEYAKL